MAQNGFRAKHWNDENGNPGGGVSYGTGFSIAWQDGPLGRGEDRAAPTGAFVEDVILACVERIEVYQNGKFPSAYNAETIRLLKAAVRTQEQRTADREARGVEGLHER